MRSIRMLARELVRASGKKPWLFALASAGVLASAPAQGPDILNWADCPPGLPYGITTDPRMAHFQTSPVAGPSGGTCSLEVVTGAFFSDANTAGGAAFNTYGEVAGATYTLGFDLQFVHGEDEWFFANENGSGDINGLTVHVPFPGDHCWHHYEFTAPLGAAGPKTILFVYQGKTRFNLAPTLEEMRIDNMTLREVRSDTPGGLSIHDDDSWARGDRDHDRECRGDRWRD